MSDEKCWCDMGDCPTTLVADAAQVSDRDRAAGLLDALDDVGDTWDQQVDRIAQEFAHVRRAAQIDQLIEAAGVLTDRAGVLKRNPAASSPDTDNEREAGE